MNKEVFLKWSYIQDHSKEKPSEAVVYIGSSIKHTRNPWLEYTFATVLLYALAGFLMGHVSEAGVISKIAVSVGGFAFVAMMILHQSYLFFAENGGRWPILKDTCLYDLSKQQYKSKEIWIGIAGGIFSFLGDVFMLVAFKHALYSQVNQGVISSILAFGVIIMAIGSYFLFRENLTPAQIMGMLVIIGGVIVISCAKSGGLSSEPPSESPLIAVFFAIVKTCFFSIRNLSAKYLGYAGISFIAISAMNILTDCAAGLALCLIPVMEGSSVFATLSFSQAVEGFLAGFAGFFGTLCLTKALILGAAAPVFAMVNTVCLYMALADWIFLGQTPSFTQILGMLVTIAGASILTLYDWFSQNKAKKILEA